MILLNSILTAASIVISVFAIVILSVLGSLFTVRIARYQHRGQELTRQQNNHHSVMGSTEDPEDGKAVATAVFGAVIIYAVFLVFCGAQAFLHQRERRRGAIALS